MVNKLVALGIDVLILCGPQRQLGSFSCPYTQAQYVAGLKVVSDATDHVAFLNIVDPWVDYTTANADGLYADSTHPSKIGHGDISRMVFQALAG